jgi:hypothetical protein
MVKAMVLMSIGLYNEPRGAYLPSVVYFGRTDHIHPEKSE